MTVLAGVIGDPIGHSRSPRLHGHWLRRYGIDGQYVALRVTPKELRATLDLLPRLGFAGINVTIPHKEAALKAADTVTARARAVGAANTLTFRGGRIHADNTDGHGFVANLAAAAPSWDRTSPALILGAGGAARGVVHALVTGGATAVIANRTRMRADALAAEFDDRVRAVDWAETDDAMRTAGLLVNATSLGMAGQPALDLSLSTLPAGAIVTDIVYTPLETALLAGARARGNVVVDGLGMLLHQAAPGFESWFGHAPEVDAELRAAVLG